MWQDIAGYAYYRNTVRIRETPLFDNEIYITAVCGWHLNN